MVALLLCEVGRITRHSLYFDVPFLNISQNKVQNISVLLFLEWCTFALCANYFLGGTTNAKRKFKNRRDIKPIS